MTASAQSGIMVNYLYDHDSIEDNHEAFVRNGTVVRSGDVDALLHKADWADAVIPRHRSQTFHQDA